MVVMVVPRVVGVGMDWELKKQRAHRGFGKNESRGQLVDRHPCLGGRKGVGVESLNDCD